MEIYRRLARKYHPDPNPATAEVMTDLNELWQAMGGDSGDSGNSASGNADRDAMRDWFRDFDGGR